MFARVVYVCGNSIFLRLRLILVFGTIVPSLSEEALFLFTFTSCPFLASCVLLSHVRTTENSTAVDVCDAVIVPLLG